MIFFFVLLLSAETNGILYMYIILFIVCPLFNKQKKKIKRKNFRCKLFALCTEMIEIYRLYLYLINIYNMYD